jgi:hypothetical protein
MVPRSERVWRFWKNVTFLNDPTSSSVTARNAEKSRIGLVAMLCLQDGAPDFSVCQPVVNLSALVKQRSLVVLKPALNEVCVL